MDKKIIVNYDAKQTRVAVLEDGKPVELYVERPVQQRVVGNIYKGVVENVLPGMQAAFVNIGQERNAFLYVDDILVEEDDQENGEDLRSPRPIQSLLAVGKEVMVQVVKEPFGNKGARLTSQITLPGRFLVLVPGGDQVGISRRIEAKNERERLKKIAEEIRPRGIGLIVRTVAEEAEKQQLQQDMDFLLKQWQKIEKAYQKEKAPAVLYQDLTLTYRIVRDLFNEEVNSFLIDNIQEQKKVLEILDYLSPELKGKVTLYQGAEPIFERYGIEKEIHKALDRFVWLSCGGYLVIDETEALTVIDVNTGRFTGKCSLADTILQTNLQAAEEIPRQLRLRDIGGIIIIDFIDMDNEEHKQLVLERLADNLKLDRTKSYLLGLTSLGLVEMTRKKVRQGLSAVLMNNCPYCNGRGKVPTPQIAAVHVERDLKKELAQIDAEAVLVEMHQEVAALLIGVGGAHLKNLELGSGKVLFIRGAEGIGVSEYRIVETGTVNEISSLAQPVRNKDRLEVYIAARHTSNEENGIARIQGFVIDIEGGGKLVGQKVLVEIVEVYRTFARAIPVAKKV